MSRIVRNILVLVFLLLVGFVGAVAWLAAIHSLYDFEEAAASLPSIGGYLLAVAVEVPVLLALGALASWLFEAAQRAVGNVACCTCLHVLRLGCAKSRTAG